MSPLPGTGAWRLASVTEVIASSSRDRGLMATEAGGLRTMGGPFGKRSGAAAAAAGVVDAGVPPVEVPGDAGSEAGAAASAPSSEVGAARGKAPAAPVRRGGRPQRGKLPFP